MAKGSASCFTDPGQFLLIGYEEVELEIASVIGTLTHSAASGPYRPEDSHNHNMDWLFP